MSFLFFCTLRIRLSCMHPTSEIQILNSRGRDVLVFYEPIYYNSNPSPLLNSSISRVWLALHSPKWALEAVIASFPCNQGGGDRSLCVLCCLCAWRKIVIVSSSLITFTCPVCNAIIWPHWMTGKCSPQCVMLLSDPIGWLGNVVHSGGHGYS